MQDVPAFATPVGQIVSHVRLRQIYYVIKSAYACVICRLRCFVDVSGLRAHCFERWVVEIKKLLILRHAKAQPDAPAGDRLRALTDRGRRDATTIGAHLHALVEVPDAFVTSDARRALQTAELAAAACGFEQPLTIEPAIYGAEAAELAEIVRRLPDAAACVVIVGHNPGLHDLVDALSGGDVLIDHLPTAGLAYLEHDATRWRDLAEGTCRFRGMTSPRLLAT